MRTFKAVLFFLAVFLLVAPAPADAWFGWLDNLSGPGPFTGWQYEFRLVCFGAEAEPKRLAAVMSEAQHAVSQLRTLHALSGAPTSVSTRTALDVLVRTQRAFGALDAELDRYDLALPVYGKEELWAKSKLLKTSLTALDGFLNDFATRRDSQESGVLNSHDLDKGTLKALINQLEQSVPQTNQLEGGYRAIESIATTGVFWSLCDMDRHRRSSLDIGFYLWSADGTSKFAGSQEIKLNTAMSFYSFRVFRDPRYDAIDAGFGGGMYWFSSLGFDPFTGVVLQPIRGDFHAPSLWASYPWKGQSGINAVLRILAIPTFRWGAMLFPGGFKGGAFGPATAQIASDLVPTWTLFFNLKPLLPRRLDAQK